MPRRIVLLRPDGLWEIQGEWLDPRDPPTQLMFDGVIQLLQVAERASPRAVYYARETS